LQGGCPYFEGSVADVLLDELGQGLGVFEALRGEIGIAAYFAFDVVDRFAMLLISPKLGVGCRGRWNLGPRRERLTRDK
jgi:hypothetical protein